MMRTAQYITYYDCIVDYKEGQYKEESNHIRKRMFLQLEIVNKMEGTLDGLIDFLKDKRIKAYKTSASYLYNNNMERVVWEVKLSSTRIYSLLSYTGSRINDYIISRRLLSTLKPHELDHYIPELVDIAELRIDRIITSLLRDRKVENMYKTKGYLDVGLVNTLEKIRILNKGKEENKLVDNILSELDSMVYHKTDDVVSLVGGILAEAHGDYISFAEDYDSMFKKEKTDFSSAKGKLEQVLKELLNMKFGKLIDATVLDIIADPRFTVDNIKKICNMI